MHPTLRLPAPRHLLGVIATSLLLHTPLHAQTLPPSAELAPTVQTAEGALRRELARGVYELVFSPQDKLLYVASAQAIPNVKGGVIYKLDPATLETVGLIHTDLKNFGLALDPTGTTLYVTNSLSSAVSALDIATGEIKARLKFDDKSADGTPYGPRQVAFDTASDALYVGGVGDPGLIWIIDPQTLALRGKIEQAGKWVTGLLPDPDNNRLYAANGDGEVLVIDTREKRIVQRWTVGDGKEALLLNLALDPANHRLFVTDHSKQKTVLVFDTRSGKVTGQLPVGDSLGIKLNPARQEIYLTHREQGTLSVLDAGDYRLLKSYPLPPNPNSLALSADGETLYVSIKTPFNKDYSASGNGSVARIPLQDIRH